MSRLSLKLPSTPRRASLKSQALPTLSPITACSLTTNSDTKATQALARVAAAAASASSASSSANSTTGSVSSDDDASLILPWTPADGGLDGYFSFPTFDKYQPETEDKTAEQ